MIASSSPPFAFIHIWKTAGSSFREILTPYSESSAFSKLLFRTGMSQSMIRDPFRRKYDVHATYQVIENAFGREKLSNLFTFAVVRNPWDWHVSLYHYMQQQQTHYQRDLAMSLKDFGEYLRWRSSEEPIDQRHFIVDTNGDVAVDYVGRFEALEEVLDVLRKRIGLEARLPVVRKSQHKDFRTYYTSDWMVDCVRKMNQTDIDEFNYTFSP